MILTLIYPILEEIENSKEKIRYLCTMVKKHNCCLHVSWFLQYGVKNYVLYLRDDTTQFLCNLTLSLIWQGLDLLSVEWDL